VFVGSGWGAAPVCGGGGSYASESPTRMQDSTPSIPDDCRSVRSGNVSSSLDFTARDRPAGALPCVTTPHPFWVGPMDYSGNSAHLRYGQGPGQRASPRGGVQEPPFGGKNGQLNRQGLRP
jgi:hypothetical protein